MFSLFNKVFGLSPAKIGQGLKESLLGDYAEDVGEFLTDVGTDVSNTATSWGKSLGLIEDKADDHTWAVQNAQDRMKPIVDKYTQGIDGSRAPDEPYDGDSWDGEPYEDEVKQPDPVPERPGAIEMSNLNPGEEAVTNSLSELLHELPSAEGKIGTDFSA